MKKDIVVVVLREGKENCRIERPLLGSSKKPPQYICFEGRFYDVVVGADGSTTIEVGAVPPLVSTPAPAIVDTPAIPHADGMLGLAAIAGMLGRNFF